MALTTTTFSGSMVTLSATYSPTACEVSLPSTTSTATSCPTATLITDQSIFNLTSTNYSAIHAQPQDSVWIRPFNSKTYELVKNCCNQDVAYVWYNSEDGVFCQPLKHNLRNISGCLVSKADDLPDGVRQYQCINGTNGDLDTCYIDGSLSLLDNGTILQNNSMTVPEGTTTITTPGSSSSKITLSMSVLLIGLFMFAVLNI